MVATTASAMATAAKAARLLLENAMDDVVDVLVSDGMRKGWVFIGSEC